MFFKNNFKFKLTLFCAFSVFISFAFLSILLYKNLEKRSLDNTVSTLVFQAGLIEAYLIPGSLKSEDTVSLNIFIKSLSKKIKCRLTIVDKEGIVVADSEEPQEAISRMDNHSRRPEIIAALKGQTGSASRYSFSLRKDMVYVALPLKDQGRISGALRLSVPLVNAKHDFLAIRNSLIWGLFFALGLAFILGSILAEAIAGPIKKMVSVSRRFSQGDFSQRLSWGYPQDEIGELAVTLNTMAQEIEDKIRKIQLQGQQLEAVFNCMAEGVIVVDKAGRIASLNPAIERIFDITGKPSKGKLFLEIIPNNDILEIINTVLGSGKFICRVLSFSWPVAGVFEFSASPVFDKLGVNGCILVLHDITEIRRLEVMRRDFVANVSHELKTPLTSINGFVETLLEGALEDKNNARQFLEIIRDHSHRLNNLINDLLELSYLESREIKLETTQVNLRDIVEKVVSGFAAQLKKKSLILYNELPAVIALKLDKDKIEQVFTNLIGNAVKFNREGGSIRIFSEKIDNRIKIIVEDSGIGIPVKDIPRIFERFYRVDKARSRELGGTGLGLSIVKHIIELHSGAVGVESTEGIGSRFWFVLPQ